MSHACQLLLEIWNYWPALKQPSVAVRTSRVVWVALLLVAVDGGAGRVCNVFDYAFGN
jgi:hypothetical protein